MTPTYTHDWITPYFPSWEHFLPPTASRILEIGCYEGRATNWFADRYPIARLTCIDTFEGGPDHKALGLDFSETEKRFTANTSHLTPRLTLCKGPSSDWLRHLSKPFDIILVDGDHTAPAVLFDLTLSWHLLSPGGTLIADDYGWGTDRPPLDTPKPAIDAFLAIHAGQYAILEQGYQVIIRKHSTKPMP